MNGIFRGYLRAAGRLALVVGVASVAACGNEGSAAPGVQARGGGGGGGPGGRGRGGPTAVETAAAERGTIARELSVSGAVEPLRTVGVNSQASGALVAVLVEEGSSVRAGQVLARLDDREVAAQVASARAQHEVARGALERAEQLRARQVITQAEYDRDRAAAAAAEAQLEALRTRLGHTVVRAPSSGVILEKQVEAGDVVGPQTRLFTLADLSTPVVRVGVSELDVVRLSPGEKVAIALDAVPGQAFEGRIRRIYPSADPQTRLVPVEVALGAEAARAARPGFLARVIFALGEREGVLQVPSSALLGGGATESLFVIADGKAERRRVETGLTSRGRVEILSGLSEGEEVVVAGNHGLRDGAEVRVVSGPGTGVGAGPGAEGSTARRPGGAPTGPGGSEAAAAAPARRGS